MPRVVPAPLVYTSSRPCRSCRCRSCRCRLRSNRYSRTDSGARGRASSRRRCGASSRLTRRSAKAMRGWSRRCRTEGRCSASRTQISTTTRLVSLPFLRSFVRSRAGKEGTCGSEGRGRPDEVRAPRHDSRIRLLLGFRFSGVALSRGRWVPTRVVRCLSSDSRLCKPVLSTGTRRRHEIVSSNSVMCCWLSYRSSTWLKKPQEKQEHDGDARASDSVAYHTWRLDPFNSSSHPSDTGLCAPLPPLPLRADV